MCSFRSTAEQGLGRLWLTSKSPEKVQAQVGRWVRCSLALPPILCLPRWTPPSARGRVKAGLGGLHGHCRSTVSGSWKLRFSLPGCFTCFATLKPCQSVEVPAFDGPALWSITDCREKYDTDVSPGLLALGVRGPPDLSRELPALCAMPWSPPPTPPLLGALTPQ